MVDYYDPYIKVTRVSELYRGRMPDITNCFVEYQKNIKELGAVSTANPWTILRQQPFGISGLLGDIAYELPLVSQFYFYLFIYFVCRVFSECLVDIISFGRATTSRSFLPRFFGHNSVFLITKYSP